MLISEALELGGLIKTEGYILNANGFEIMDLGDDIYTQGKPHPMIDPDVRIRKIKEYSKDADTGVILLDIVLGYGSHPDMVNALLPTIKEALTQAEHDQRSLYFVASVCGTQGDPQNYDKSVSDLKEAGVLVETSNARAVRLALRLMGKEFVEVPKQIVPYEKVKLSLPAVSAGVDALLNSTPSIINLGIESFTDSILAFGGTTVQFDWRPVAGGNRTLIKILNDLNRRAEIDQSNEKVIGRMRDSQPFLMDVVPAKSVISELNGKVLLHAGPPIQYLRNDRTDERFVHRSCIV